MAEHGSRGGLSDEPVENHLAVIRRFIQYLWPAGQPGLKAQLILSLCLLAAAKGLTVYTPSFFKDAIDALAEDAADVMSLALGLILAYGLARFGSMLFGDLRDLAFIRVAQNAIRKLNIETFEHLHRLSMRFHLERQTGGLARAMDRGTRSIEFALQILTFNVVPTILELGMVTAIFYVKFGGLYAAILGLAIVAYVTITFLVTEWRLKYRRRMNDEEQAAGTKAVDSLINFETVKYFGNEAHEAARYDTTLAGYQKAAVKSQVTLTVLNVSQRLIINICLVVVMGLSARDYLAGVQTIGDVVLVNTLLIQLFMPLGFLGTVYREIKQSLVDMDYLFNLLDAPAEIEDSPTADDLEVNGAAIEFENVSFHYDEARPILHDVSFKVPAGATVAVVGPSGAGKSTISRILFRFYDISAGAVRIDEQDIREVTQQSLRSTIGMVPQDTVLFNDTIRYNIAYGRPGANDEDVERAASLARIDSFIESLPNGYDTMVGERGLKLSGGEKQRVAIARTILKNPAILLLDEATSALDTGTEREIQSSLRTISKDRTTLVIAHRLSTIVDADEILVIEAGRIQERGRHQDLLALNGIYAQMWARQQEAAEVSERLETLKSDRMVCEPGAT